MGSGAASGGASSGLPKGPEIKVIGEDAPIIKSEREDEMGNSSRSYLWGDRENVCVMSP